jgi:ribosomal protein S18 acetylase RimI-like enzyme
MTIKIISAQSTDLPRIGELYQLAFPEALQAVFGRPHIPPRAVEDVLAQLYDVEPQGFFVACSEEHLAGFMIVTSDLAALRRMFLLRGKLFRLLVRWIFGRYRGLGVGFLARLGKIWWAYRSAGRMALPRGPLAQIVSVVVDRPFQGKGIGKALSERALAYLRTTSARIVRLEVDAAKTIPIGLYQKLGFATRATIPTPRGPALVMTLRLK